MSDVYTLGGFDMNRLSRRAVLGAAIAIPATLSKPFVRPSSAATAASLAGQLIIYGFSGSSAESADAQRLARDVEAGLAGGVCFLGYNARSQEGLLSLTRLFGDAGTPFIAIDQEGGKVQRLSPRIGYPAVLPASDIARTKTPEEAEGIYQRMASTLRGAGFTLNLAPVVDLGFQPKNPVVTAFGRAYGVDGATVSRYAAAFVRGHRAARMLTALKHFPGHGSTLVDSHLNPVDLGKTWREDELEPYRALTRQGLVDIVMTGHLALERFAARGEPATLSGSMIGGLLRRDIGYDGAVMTDDLDMRAIRSRYDNEEAVVRALAAGNDLVLVSNSATPDGQIGRKVVAAVAGALGDGTLSARTLEQAVARVSALKRRL